MAEGFEALGIRSELVRVAGESGYATPTTLQRAAIPVLRRGGNAVLHASAGAGVVAAYGLALLDRLADAGAAPGEPRALVLTATAENALRTATSLARFARAVGLRVAASGPGWARPTTEADVVVATPGDTLEAVRTSLLKLDTVETLVLDGLAAIHALGAQDATEMLTTSVAREAQRVVITAELSPEIESYVERHVRRALNIPAVAREAELPTPTRSLAYAATTERNRTDLLAVLLAEQAPSGPAVVHCRGRERAAAVAEALALRGFPAALAGAEGAGITVTADPADAHADTLTISYDVPFDAETLAARHAAGGLVLVEPRELAHLRIIASRTGFTLTAQPVAEPAPARDEITAFRDRLKRALVEEDIGAQLLVLDPLFAEFAAVEVAGAASALLRRRAPAAAAPAPAVPATAPAPPPAAYVRLFIGIGSRDGIRPGDLVGAITGEANVTGAEVGRIEIRESHSVVEVASDAAPRIIEALNGTTLRGRSLRVDYDRRAGATRGGREGPAERPRRRPPRERDR